MKRNWFYCALSESQSGATLDSTDLKSQIIEMCRFNQSRFHHCFCADLRRCE